MEHTRTTAESPSRAAVLVALNEESNITDAVEALMHAYSIGAIDHVYVVDGGSRDRTVPLAMKAGATVIEANEVLTDWGPVLGKGDSMWRASAVVQQDIIAFMDADIAIDYGAAVRALIAPLLTDPRVHFVKGTFVRLTETLPRRPTAGRVTELVARPLLSLLEPDLAGLREPLSGQVAIRRTMLRSLCVVTNYGVEAGMLVDVHRRVGLSGIAQADLGVLHNPPQTDMDLEGMARDVMVTLLRRLAQGSLSSSLSTPHAEPVERPPISTIRR